MKIYINLFLIIILLSCQTFGQVLKSNFEICDYKPLSNHLSTVNKSSSDTIIYNTFDDVNDWTISAANLQGQWQIVSTTPQYVDQYMGSMASQALVMDLLFLMEYST